MTTTNKRARELARAKEERRRAREEAERIRRRKRRRIIAICAVIAVVAAAGIGWVVTRPDETPSSEASNPAANTPAAQAISHDTQLVESCTDPGEIQAAPQTFASPGDSGLGSATAATFTFTTNCGDVVISANRTAAPQTVDAMAFLAGQGYFDQTLCHRVTTEGLFVLQCGDPTASGSGDPGFQLPDENLPAQESNNYPAGTIAMANSGPGTSGSQFFIVYQDTTLPANYSIWGTVTSGLDAVSAVAAAGTTDGSTDGAPAQAVMIQDVAVQAQ